MEQKLQAFEKQLEQSLDKLTSHPLFLQTVAGVINFNCYRKIASRKALELLWGQLQIPLKADQEKMMAAIEEIQIRVQKIQLEQSKKVVLSEAPSATIHQFQAISKDTVKSGKKKVSSLNS